MLAPHSYGADADAEGRRLRPQVFTAGVSLTANHTSASQAKNMVTHLKSVTDLFKDSPLPEQSDLRPELITIHQVGMKLTGVHGDHAEDQKKKFRLVTDWKHDMVELGIGELCFYERPEDEWRSDLMEIEKSLIASVGGELAWAQLNETERDLQS